MELNDDEKRYEHLVRNLKQLKKIKAPDYFEADLLRRINSGKFKEEKGSSWKIFAPARLVSSIVVVVVAIIVVFMIETFPTKQIDPLSVNPPLRKDLLQENQGEELSSGKIINKKMEMQSNESKRGQKQNNTAGKNKLYAGQNSVKSKEIPSPTSNFYDKSNNTAIAGISMLSGPALKEGLNYKQVNLSKSQKKEVYILKQKMVESFKEDGK